MSPKRVEKKEFVPKTNFTDKQKIAAFDKLRDEAKLILDRHQAALKEGAEAARHEDDMIHAHGEETMMLTLGNNVFENWQKEE